MSPVLDTQVLFAFNPRDKYHKYARNLLNRIKSGHIRDVIITDVNIWEFVAVLKARGFSNDKIKKLLLAIKKIMIDYNVKFKCTMDLDTMLNALEYMKNASFFDALIAASAEKCDRKIISDDDIYDKLNLVRIPFKSFLY